MDKGVGEDFIGTDRDIVENVSLSIPRHWALFENVIGD